MVSRLGDFQDAADVGNGIGLGNQLISRFELADDLLRCVASSFHGGVPGPVWPDEDSHSALTDSKGPSQFQQGTGIALVSRKVDRRHAMTIRLCIDNQPDQDQTPGST